MDIDDNLRIWGLKGDRLILKGDLNKLEEIKNSIMIRINEKEEELKEYIRKGYIEAAYEDFSVYKNVNTYMSHRFDNPFPK